MRSYSITSAVVLVSLFSAIARANIIYGPVVDPSNDQSYYVTSAETWTLAQADAQSIGGNLATIHNAAENAWINSTFIANLTSSGGPNLSSAQLWFGFYDPKINDGSGATHAADFQWADGEPVIYTNWNPMEPNNNLGDEYYAVLNYYHDGTWNDVPLDGFGTVPYGIVEVPEPASATLIACGCALLLMRGTRRRAAAAATSRA